MRRRADAAAAGVPPASWSAMRLLYAGNHYDGACPSDAGASRERGPHSRRAVWKYLPLHRLSVDRQVDYGRPSVLSIRSQQRGASMSARANLVGQPILRIEDLRLLRGEGRYVDDIHREGMLHAAILRSSVAHGILRDIDTSEVAALPGVHAVITSSDLGEVPHIPVRLFPNPDMEPFRQPVLACGKVRFVGEPMVLVVADSAAIAEDALELIAVRHRATARRLRYAIGQGWALAAIRRAQLQSGVRIHLHAGRHSRRF